MGHYQSEAEIEALVAGFESCTTGVDDFNHRDHLTVAVWYLRSSTPEQAFQKMCSGLIRFLDHHKVGRAKYDERLTMQWIKLIHATVEGMNPDLSLLEVTNLVIERFGETRLVADSSTESADYTDSNITGI
jgi:hypothetical protein